MSEMKCPNCGSELINESDYNYRCPSDDCETSWIIEELD